MATKTIKTLPTDNLALVNECAASVAAMKGAYAQAEEFKAQANLRIAALHKGKVTIGRYGVCLLATAFKDALIAADLADGTAGNYLSTFRNAVKTGEPVTDWNPNRADSKGTKGKGKGKGAKGSKGFDELLAAVFNHDGGETLKGHCEQWDKLIDDAVYDGVYDCIRNFLIAEGYELAE